jgi:hypothetical protein
VIFCPHATIFTFSNLREVFRQKDKLSLVVHELASVPRTAATTHDNMSATDPQRGRVPILICLKLGVVNLLRLQNLVPSTRKSHKFLIAEWSFHLVFVRLSVHISTGTLLLRRSS